jgi:hypothetical protein
VVDNLAQGVEAAGIDTRVFALLGETSLVTCAILVDDTLRIVASSGTIHHTALSIDRARRWVAWISDNCARKKQSCHYQSIISLNFEFTWHFLALDKWISSQRRWASANRAVVDNVALSRVAADSRARINALLTHASLVSGAVGAEHALRPASGIWAAEVSWQALASGAIRSNSAASIWSAR